MKQIILGLIVNMTLLVMVPSLHAQNNIPTSKPFLKANLDARSTSLAGGGAALSADAYSIYNNASKALLGEQTMAIGLSYTPWRPNLDKNIRLFSMGGYYNFNQRHSILVGMRYFTNVGPKIKYGNLKEYAPYDYSIDLGYGIALCPDWSLSLVGSYATSHFTCENASRDLCMSIGTTYRYTFTEAIRWTTALNIANIGVKNFDDHPRNLVPTTYTWGNGVEFIISPKHQFTTTIDAIGYSNAGSSKNINHTVVAMGAEYSFCNMLYLRTGYRLAFSDKDSGSYSYFTSGIGFKYQYLSLDGAYIMAAKDTPMQNAWWLTTTFSF